MATEMVPHGTASTHSHHTVDQRQHPLLQQLQNCLYIIFHGCITLSMQRHQSTHARDAPWGWPNRQIVLTLILHEQQGADNRSVNTEITFLERAVVRYKGAVGQPVPEGTWGKDTPSQSDGCPQCSRRDRNPVMMMLMKSGSVGA
jgi:hypothetical protein